MLHIAITAGGTIEDIDEVRKITNTSTGRMGVELCEALIHFMESAQPNQAYTIHYLTTQTALKPPKHPNIKVYYVTDTESVLTCIQTLFKVVSIQFFIHCMAISDFTTRAIVPLEELATEIVESLKKAPVDLWQTLIEEKLRNPEAAIAKNKKVSSQSDLLISLQRTPKVISQIKKLNPDVLLVGFKLLKNVDESELIQVACDLAIQNNCDLVLANDLQTVQEGTHVGLLIKNQTVTGRYEGKKAIAKAIIEEMFKIVQNTHAIQKRSGNV